MALWPSRHCAELASLTYATAGHHPAYLVPPDRAGALPLKTSGPMIGATPDSRFSAARIHVPAGARLYLISDGIFEIVTKDGRWCLDDFVRLLWRPIVAGVSECERLHGAAKAACHPGQFEDDVSLLIVTVP